MNEQGWSFGATDIFIKKNGKWAPQTRPKNHPRSGQLDLGDGLVDRARTQLTFRRCG
jgi:hypothetical protein